MEATARTASTPRAAKGTVMSTSYYDRMPTPRIHCDQRLGPGAQFALDADAAQHVAKSLRLKAGDSLVVFDGRGGEYDAAIQRIDRDRVDVKVGGLRDAARESQLQVGLVQGLPEADKMDWIIQKATELGAAWIQPVTCDRSQSLGSTSPRSTRCLSSCP